MGRGGMGTVTRPAPAAAAEQAEEPKTASIYVGIPDPIKPTGPTMLHKGRYYLDEEVIVDIMRKFKGYWEPHYINGNQIASGNAWCPPSQAKSAAFALEQKGYVASPPPGS